jgi:hypothetical protein
MRNTVGAVEALKISKYKFFNFPITKFPNYSIQNDSIQP